MVPDVVALITAVSNPNPCRRIQKVRRTPLRTSERVYRTIAFDVLQHGKFTCHVLRELSNFCCLPGRAGGSPNGLEFSSSHCPFLAPLSRGHGEMGKPPARWRHGGLLLCPSADGHPPGLRFPQETKRRAKFLGSPTKSSPWPGEQAPLALFVPREKRAQKRRKNNDRANQTDQARSI